MYSPHYFLLFQGDPPSYLFSLVGITITLIMALLTSTVWFIRIEGKVNRNTEAIAEIKKEQAEFEKALYEHLVDAQKHYNREAMQEWRNAWDARFKYLEGLTESINKKLDHLKP